MFLLEIVFRNIFVLIEKVSFRIVVGMVFMFYMVFFMIILSGFVYFRMDVKDKFFKKISIFLIVFLMILLFIFIKIIVLFVIFIYFVIKFLGISDFSIYSYIIKFSEYLEEFFFNLVWDRKKIKVGEYYLVWVVFIFIIN